MSRSIICLLGLFFCLCGRTFAESLPEGFTLGRQLVANGSFETDTRLPGVPDSWRFTRPKELPWVLNEKAAGKPFSILTDESAKDGAKSWNLGLTQEVADYYKKQGVLLIGGNFGALKWEPLWNKKVLLRLSFMAKEGSFAGTVKMRMYKKGVCVHWIEKSFNTAGAPPGTWLTVEGTGVIPEGTDAGDVQIYSYPRVPCNLFLDQLEVLEVTPPKMENP